MLLRWTVTPGLGVSGGVEEEEIFLQASKFCLVLLPENWVCLLVGVEPKDTTKPKIRRRKELLLAACKENTGIFPKVVSS